MSDHSHYRAREHAARDEIARHIAADNPRPIRLSEQTGLSQAQYFLVRCEAHCWLGRRTIESVNGHWTCHSLLREGMLVGPLLEWQLLDERVDFYVDRVGTSERAEFFRYCVDSTACLISFPFAAVRNELAPPQTWTPTETMAARMAEEERHFQQHVAAMLRQHAVPGAQVYDPACSTGDFLAALQAELPAFNYRGSDLSLAMIDFARQRHRAPPIVFRHADANDAIGVHDCDVLVLRFLNVEVVTRDAAEQLFRRLSVQVRPGGLIVVFGHTPVLLPVPYLAAELGLTIVSSSGATTDGTAIFACFVLKA